MNLFESLLEEIFLEKVVKVKHGSIRVKHMKSGAKKKAKAFRIKNKTKLKMRAKRRKLKLRSKPKAKAGYSYNASGRLVKKVRRLGLRKR